MATLTGARHDPAIKAFYARLKAAGTLPKVVLVACLRRRLTTLDALAKTNRPWDTSLPGA